MSNEKQQIKKVSKERQEYLKFKPFADDLRKAESWCELDGVLNRYQTVKNLSKMGYRKQSEDMVPVETVKKWLYEIAINNVGCVVDGDFSNACEEIISRLDGLKRFAEEKKGGE